jgi:hypothetical protein
VLITTVHLIQSCHLDAGFTGLAKDVLNKYFTHHIPTAIKTATNLRKDTSIPKTWRMKFMMQTYYLSLYLDCPLGMGLACPSSNETAALREAITRGEITWHAYPHNAELENTSPVMLEEGILSAGKSSKALTMLPPYCDLHGVFLCAASLDAEFSLPAKRFLSQRDVPGVPRSVIPLLVKHGVNLVTVGVNGASMYPRYSLHDPHYHLHDPHYHLHTLPPFTNLMLVDLKFNATCTPQGPKNIPVARPRQH